MKAVLFDVYETLLTTQGCKPSTEESILRKYKIPPETPIRSLFQTAVARAHADSPHPFPEVDVRELWKSIFPSLTDTDKFALEIEDAIHPVQVVVGARMTLRNLQQQGIRLGIVSNAQAYTRTLLKRYLSDDWLLFEPALLAFSFEHHRAKPDPFLFEQALAPLMSAGISTGEILMVGDSIKNDMVPAKALGLHSFELIPGKPFPSADALIKCGSAPS